MLTVYIIATCFGLFYEPSSGNTLHKIQVFIPRDIICKLANNISRSLQKKSEYVAVLIYVLNTPLCSMGQNKNMS